MHRIYETNGTTFPTAKDSRSVSFTLAQRAVGAASGVLWSFFWMHGELDFFADRDVGVANSVSLAGVVLGALAGALRPRLGFLIAHGLILFICAMLSRVLGDSPDEHLFAFAFFTGTDLLFIVTWHCILHKE